MPTTKDVQLPIKGPKIEGPAVDAWNSRAELAPNEELQLQIAEGLRAERQSSRIAALEAELAGTKDKASTAKGLLESEAKENAVLRKIVTELQSQLTLAIAQRDRAVAVLRPFANFAPPDGFDRAFPDDVAITPGSKLAKQQLTFGDLRRARHVITEIEEGK